MWKELLVGKGPLTQIYWIKNLLRAQNKVNIIACSCYSEGSLRQLIVIHYVTITLLSIVVENLYCFSYRTVTYNMSYVFYKYFFPSLPIHVSCQHPFVTFAGCAFPRWFLWRLNFTTVIYITREIKRNT